MSDATPDATQGDSRRDSRGDVSRDMSRDIATVTEAAKRLGVTVRTVQRRLDRGELKSIEADGKRLVVLPAGATAGATGDTTAGDSDTRHDATGDATPHDSGGAFMAHLVEENAFLRRAVEQRDRDAAELRAALRKALDAMPKAITAPADSDAPQAPQLAAFPQKGNQAQPARNGARRPAQRALWRVILGIR
jgi:excisionase family DNA binding protein